jgi:hypothetical protein
LSFGFVSAQSQGFSNLLLRQSLAKAQKSSLRIGYYILSNALTLSGASDAEKLTVMFSVPHKKEGIFVKPESQLSYGQYVKECETVSHSSHGRMGGQSYRANLKKPRYSLRAAGAENWGAFEYCSG